MTIRRALAAAATTTAVLLGGLAFSTPACAQDVSDSQELLPLPDFGVILGSVLDGVVSSVL